MPDAPLTELVTRLRDLAVEPADGVANADFLRRYVQDRDAVAFEALTRRKRKALVTRRSWSLGKVFQLENRVAMTVRNCLFRRRFGERQGIKLFEQLMGYESPELKE
jgi:hypothetical protein